MSQYTYIGKDGKAVLARDLEDERDALKERVKKLEIALMWYAYNTKYCRKLGNEGDIARQALDRDGGKTACRALADEPTQ